MNAYWRKTALFFCLSNLYVVMASDAWFVSKGDPEPSHIWRMSKYRKDTVYDLTHTYAELHDIKFIGEDPFGILSFVGSDSYVYINNSDSSFDGSLAMSWMMYVQPEPDHQRSTLLRYQKQDGSSSFHLELLQNLSLSCILKSTETTHSIISGKSDLTLETNMRKFIGVNFHFGLPDHEAEFEFFTVFTDIDGTQKESTEKFKLSLSFELDLNESVHIFIGNGFHGNISCIQYYNASIIHNPKKNAPCLCDPVLAFVNDTFEDYTIDLAPVEVTTVPTQTSFSTKDALYQTEDYTTDHSQDLTSFEVTTVPTQTKDALYQSENCVMFKKTANGTSLSGSVQFQIVDDVIECAKLCIRTRICWKFSISQIGGKFLCCLGELLSRTIYSRDSWLYTLL